MKPLSKDSAQYWEKRIRIRPGCSQFSVRLAQDGREEWFNLRSSIKAQAAAKAREIWYCLRTEAWDAAICKYKPEAAQEIKASELTVGDYLTAADATMIRKGFSPVSRITYSQALLWWAGKVKGWHTHEHKGAARKAVKFAELTDAAINAAINAMLTAVADSPAQLASTRRTINGMLGKARGLMLLAPDTGLALPSPLPFANVKRIAGVQAPKYQSQIDGRLLITLAKKELSSTEPECYKVVLLALAAGLRAREIDYVEWGMLDFVNNTIQLRETNWLRLKSASSAATVDVDPGAMSELQALMPKATSEFVVTSEYPPSVNPLAWRCRGVLEKVYSWLRSKGVTHRKPLHDLRKEAGSIIAAEYGIFAAQQFLRHSRISTTAEHYVDKRVRYAVNLGQWLEGNEPREIAAVQ